MVSSFAAKLTASLQNASFLPRHFMNTIKFYVDDLKHKHHYAYATVSHKEVRNLFIT
jgi:hypothetical protein